MASPRVAGTCTRFTCRSSPLAARVARPTPISAPGRKRSAPGRQRSQASITRMVPSPSRAASRSPPGPNWRAASSSVAGNASRLSRPEAWGLASNITWTWDSTMRMPMPASIPCTTAGAVTRNQQPRRKRPASSCRAPANTRIGPSMATPCSRTSSKTSTASPAAGPLTCSGEPASQPTTRPPMMPVTRPLAGGMPEAMAMPMHSGRATRKTTTEASASRGNVFLSSARRMASSPERSKGHGSRAGAVARGGRQDAR